MSRNLTKIEQDALMLRLQERAKEMIDERLNGNGVPFITELELYTARGTICTARTKRGILEKAFLEGMVEALKVFNAFRQEIKQGDEGIK